MPTPVSFHAAWHVFLAFLRLGLTAFGGPVAHLAYFRTEFVQRRAWLSDRDYSELVALCQFLPGPASSQVGMALGLQRAGWPGLAAAWLGFTLPSALILMLFAYGVAGQQDLAQAQWLHGLKIVAVAVVAQAVWGMGRSLCPDRLRAGIAVVAAVLALKLPGTLGQVGAIVLAACAGLWLVRVESAASPLPLAYPVTPRQGMVAALVLVVLLLGLPLWAAAGQSLVVAVVDGVLRAGTLVFGGGHVVLPLLQAELAPTATIDDGAFLAGYGAAQAVPGPLFTFGAYLGTVADWPLQGWLGGIVLLVALFLPGFLVLVAALPFWASLRSRASVQNAMAGINAGVVGILLAALYDPVWTSAIQSRSDFALALTAFALLMLGRLPPVLIVVGTAAFAGLLLPA